MSGQTQPKRVEVFVRVESARAAVEFMNETRAPSVMVELIHDASAEAVAVHAQELIRALDRETSERMDGVNAKEKTEAA